MSYLALYRKFRPKSFNMVVGQEHITTTLKNQIINEQISHAYLFCGSRGTGKTSIAKIFAQSINCEKPVNGNACGKCKTCLVLSEPNNMDILEIDAASNNRVDEIRELREKVKYPPVNGKYKVYIIDEVHMLTDSAFNALLKTLEEPPKHVVFILATTEVQKLPATILSRCLRFDFKLLTKSELETHLKNVLKEIKVEYEDEAISLIASLGEGSVRDMLSIADTVVSFSNSKVTYDSVLKSVGAIDKRVLFSLAGSILSKSPENVISIIDEIIKNGKNVTQIAKDLGVYFRDLAVIKTTNNYTDILNYPEHLLKDLENNAKLFNIEQILDNLRVFTSLDNDFRNTTNPRLLLEVTALNQINKVDYNELLLRIENLEKSISGNDKKSVGVKAGENTKVKDIQIKEAEIIVDVDSSLLKNTFNNVNEIVKEQVNLKEDVFNSKTNIADDEINGEAKSVFGKLLVVLREQDEIILHSLLGTIKEIELKNNELTIFVYDETKLKALNKPANENILLNILKTFDEGLSFKVVLKEETQEKNNIENALKQMFGDNLIIE